MSEERTLEILQVAWDAICGRELALRIMENDAKHGGPEHDDTHTPFDWRDFIRTKNGEAIDEWTQIFHPDYRIVAAAAERYEDKLFDVAALAIAAIRSSRRKRGYSNSVKPVIAPEKLSMEGEIQNGPTK